MGLFNASSRHFDPEHSLWPNRDRFILSAGHGSMLQYALLYLTGYKDMTLDEIRVLLRFKDAPAEDCGAVNRMLDEHMAHVETRIRELRVLQRQLRSLRDQCLQATSAADCGILNGLIREATAAQAEPAQPSSRLGHVHGTHRAQQAGQATKTGTPRNG